MAYRPRVAVSAENVPFLVIDGEWVRGYQVGQPFSEEFARSLFGL